MSLWTPGGEHEVPADQQPEDPDLEDLSPAERARLETMAHEMAEVRQQLLEVPASMVVANHVMGLYELAAIHLSAQPPSLDEGRVAIDAMAAVVDALEGRLGENERVLRDALAQLRLAYVQLQGVGADDVGADEVGADDNDN